MDSNQLELQNIYSEFQPRILHYLSRLVSVSEAEDLTQEVFIKVSQGLNMFRGECQLSTWLYRIATNVAMDRLRSPAYQRVVETADADVDDVGIWMAEKTLSVEQHITRDEMCECIAKYVKKLPGNYRSVVVLSMMEGFSNKEIAEILKLSLETVKIRLHRGKVRLKLELEANCNFSYDEDNEFVCDPKCACWESEN
jgi:RNA polymerase sigma-70 factor (ECF subfamily)